MDKMTIYEAADIVKNILYVDRNDREMDRYKLYVSIQSNSKNKIKVEDIFSLPWDENNKHDWNEEDDKKLNEMNEKMSSMIDMLNKGMKVEEARF